MASLHLLLNSIPSYISSEVLLTFYFNMYRYSGALFYGILALL